MRLVFFFWDLGRVGLICFWWSDFMKLLCDWYTRLVSYFASTLVNRDDVTDFWYDIEVGFES